MSPQEILLRAAELIEKRGWCQDRYSNDKGCLCPLGAMRVATGYRAGTENEQCLGKIRPAVFRIGDLDNCNISDWNDAPGQTKENVIATMRACAAIWRAKQENTDASKAAGPEVSVCDSGAEPEAGISRGAVCDDLQTQAAD